MERKTIGAFIAVLRKANGLTQQQLADSLNISNKAVSRWERDECAPDITLVPALAEVLGVTCDELLKGERITSDFQQEKSEPKIDRQIKALINRPISNFKIFIWISIALSLAGLICMFGISYGAYRPVIGFVVMCPFVVVAFILTVIGVSKLKEVKRDNELFENADATLIERYNKTLGNFSLFSFSLAIIVFAVSVPYLFILAIAENDYVVLTFSAYLLFFSGIFPALVLLALAIKGRYCSWITEQPYTKKVREKNKKLFLMNILQFTVVGIALFILSFRWLFEDERSSTVVNIIGIIGAYALPALNLIIYVIFIAVGKSDRKKLAFWGLRNLFMVFPLITLKFAQMIEVISHKEWLYGQYYDGVFTNVSKTVIDGYSYSWAVGLIFLAVNIALYIFMVFQIIHVVSRRKT